MIAVVQRVTEATVTVEATGYRASIGPGLCVLLAVERDDTSDDALWMTGKLARLRIFRDHQDKMNRSVQEVDGRILLVSQFTLAGDCTRGNRPSFVNAAEPEAGERLFNLVQEHLVNEYGLVVATGVFGAMMQVHLVNDGPVTLVIRRP